MSLNIYLKVLGQRKISALFSFKCILFVIGRIREKYLEYSLLKGLDSTIGLLKRNIGKSKMKVKHINYIEREYRIGEKRDDL